jgi:hypothetical protein
MRTILPRLWVAAALAVAAGTASAQGSAPAAGQVVVLDNERLLEGTVERQGDQLCVRRAGGELVLPAARVLKVCASRQEAFAFLCTRANLRDPDERLRLARWCQFNGLNEEGIRQAAIALNMRPSVEGRQLVEVMKRSAAVAAVAPVAAPPRARSSEAPPNLDVNLESVNAFATRVQPVLMNTCVKCHSGGRGGRFCLTRAYDSGPVNRRAVQQNLAAVLAQVNLERPELSPLLIKAVSRHGSDDQPPIRGREAPPFRLLLEWIRMTAAANPHLRQTANAAADNPSPPTLPAELAPAKLPARSTRNPAPLPTNKDSDQQGPVVVSAPVVFESAPLRPNENISPGARRAPARPALPPNPADEFDPVLFNQQTSRH